MNAILDFARFFVLGVFCWGSEVYSGWFLFGCLVRSFVQVGGFVRGVGFVWGVLSWGGGGGGCLGVLSGGVLLGGFVPGWFCPRGIVRGVLSGEFCPGDFIRGGGFCPGVFCPRGGFVHRAGATATTVCYI